MSEFMTQISDTVNSIRNRSKDDYSNYDVLEQDAMDTDSVLGKRNEPPSVAGSDLRDGGNKK